MRPSIVAFVVLVGSVSCKRYWVCDAVEGDNRLPERLSQTGIDDDGVIPYEPRFHLWSDGATKRRFIRLPPGTAIDKSDPDDWDFPRGTKLWKEFSRDDRRIETRLLQRLDDGTWAAMAYVWTADGRDAIATPAGAVNANGSPHDVPAAGECNACHGGRKSHVLGYSALQLGEVAVADTTNEEALGYLHANCSHCHNQARPASEGARCFNPENELDFRVLANGDAPAERTARAKGVVVPGKPEASRLVDLVSHRGMFQQMPPLATRTIDEEGVATLKTWIAGMKP